MTEISEYPSLYQINTRTWLNELSHGSGTSASLDAVPDQALDEIAAKGFDWVWMMGIWQTGHAGRQIASEIPQLRQEYMRILPDFSDEDVCGSPFAVQEFHVHADFGGDAALQRFRRRLAERGLRLMLDFIANHTAIDHPWVNLHPEYYIQGSQQDWEKRPNDYVRLETGYGMRYLAHGRDPYFPPWSDTLQLNYRDAGLRQAMEAELGYIASMCDGVRCDMAMLLLPEVILRTWGEHSLPAYGDLEDEVPARSLSGIDDPFWPEAIRKMRQQVPGFLFLAEVYWDLEPRLLEQGFDYCYDKHLYDHLRAGDAASVRQHLSASPDTQDRLVRFLENHDEQRAAQAFPGDRGRAAAVLCYLAPGLRFFQHGQLEGRRIRQPVQLCRSPIEAPDEALRVFYGELLDLLRGEILRHGDWCLLPCLPASDSDPTWNNFIAYGWSSSGSQQSAPAAGTRLLAVVNYSAQPGRCIVNAGEGQTTTTVLLASQPEGSAHWQSGGLAFDLPAWGFQVLKVEMN